MEQLCIEAYVKQGVYVTSPVFSFKLVGYISAFFFSFAHKSIILCQGSLVNDQSREWAATVRSSEGLITNGADHYPVLLVY